MEEDEGHYIPGVGYVTEPLVAEPSWKKDPRYVKTFLTNDGDLVLYTIGALGEALGKSPVTIRLWIRKGIIPDAGLKTAPLHGTLGNAGRRLFSLEQIEALVFIAKTEGVIGSGVGRPADFSKTSFQARVWGLWSEKGW